MTNTTTSGFRSSYPHRYHHQHQQHRHQRRHLSVAILAQAALLVICLQSGMSTHMEETHKEETPGSASSAPVPEAKQASTGEGFPSPFLPEATARSPISFLAHILNYPTPFYQYVSDVLMHPT